MVSAEAELDLGVLAVTDVAVRQYLDAVEDEQPAYFDLALAPPLALSAWSLGALLKQLALPPGAIHRWKHSEGSASAKRFTPPPRLLNPVNAAT